MNLVLASTSRYRQTLLQRLGLAFQTAAPAIDESPRPDEDARDLALRLAQAKARAVASRYPDALIIGSDQVCCCDGTLLGKPGNHANATLQLRMLSGRTAEFHTALCVLNSATGQSKVRLVTNPVEFRAFDDAAVERYLRREPAYDCAGSAKSEGLGITLIQKLGGDDPNALVGLPLIALVDLLREHGLEIP